MAASSKPFLPLAKGGSVEAHPQGAPASKRRPRRARLGHPLLGCDHREGSPARRWCKKGDPQTEALGYSQGGFSTKVHIRAEGGGKPIVFVLSGGQRNEMIAFEPVMEQGEVKRAGRGRPRVRPHRICADKGYAKGVIRRYLRRRGIRITIARRSNEHIVAEPSIGRSTALATASSG